MKKLLFFAFLAISLAAARGAGKVGFSVSPQSVSVPAGSEILLEARFDIPEGVHIYPQKSEFGMPTKIDAELPAGFALKEISFPPPQYFEFMGVKALGYSAPFAAKIKIAAPPAPAASQTLKISASWLECSDTCVPNQAYALATADITRGADTPGGFWLAVLGAILGGLILNAMPCVFPVIGLKVVSFASAADGSKKSAMLNSAVFAAGIIFTFALLGAVIAALKSFGGAVGWGFQLQSAGFTLAMAGLFWLISLNFAGFWQFGATLSASAASINNRRTGGLAESFASGVLAVLVASPCVAPFMASAVGFALAGGASPAESVAVLASVGAGMALPYVFLAAFPGALKILPKSGRWLDILKRAMSLPMFASTAWLAWVASRQGAAFWGISAMLALLAAAAFVWGRFFSPLRPRRTRIVAAAACAALVAAAAMAALPQKHSAQKTSEPPNAWSPARVERLRESGKAVFVDFTASWCLTCQYNKQILRSKKISALLSANNIATLVADYTNQSPAITAELKKYGRAGVPLYLLFPPDPSAPPVILPAILTPSAVMEAVDKIKQ